MTKEQKFYKALQDVFIGAEIEGKGGFINLMRIKSGYYSQIEKLLQKNIDNALEKHPAFRNELFDKLYSFFSRYFTESGSIYFNSTPFHNNIYEKVYTDEKDVILFWKTQMLYYVKTDRIFRSLPIEFDEFKFYFDASKIENKKANEKRSIVFEFDKVQEDRTIIFSVAYSEQGRITKQDEILKTIKRKGIAITEEQLERAFRVFEKQSEVDFFINKNAKAFLEEQFKLWSYQYFWGGAKDWSADRINQLQILKDIAFKVIDFVAQFEDELVKIWNKPKFVKNSNYVITLDKIKNENLIEKILNHKNIKEQIKEWQEISIVDEKFKISDIFEKDLTGEHLSKKYEHLPIDTKYFKDLELEILGQFDDLDKSLDGWLIKSENYQALNTILPKFKEKVQTIYIDPPFNLDSSDQFLYRTNYKDSNWATLLENRLKIAKYFLADKGSIFVRCDYNGNWIVRCLMDDEFGKENFKNEVIISRISKQDPKVQKFNTATDSLFFYSKTDAFQFNLLFKQLAKAKAERWHAMDSQGQGQPLYIFRHLLTPPVGRHWTYGQENIKQMENEERIRLKCRKCGYIHISGIWKECPRCKSKDDVKVEYLLSPTEVKQIDSNWTDISGYTSSWDFQTENSEILLKRVIESTSNEKDLIMDYFLGSGTTTAVAHKLGRKWLGVEMGEHFYTVVLPRMKKVLAYDKSGISKEVKDYQGGGFFKYYELEQYEEALDNCKYEDGGLFNSPSKTPYQEYVFMKDEKMLKAIEIDYEKNKVDVDLNKLYPNIDIAETLSNLTGKWIKRISNGEVEFEDSMKINTKNLNYKVIKSLIWWAI
ncbi:DNA methylase N-4/N-6 domain protein [groundwater metagenome]|uniref:DNA methylase N-4/N-6 domain protein n=1 Tax=groundwater metagenome TaxID=717931 RepID=A0A098E9B0_9ZZZZ